MTATGALWGDSCAEERGHSRETPPGALRSQAPVLLYQVVLIYECSNEWSSTLLGEAKPPKVFFVG